MADSVAFQIDPDKRFKKLISDVAKDVGDLTIPYVLMTKDWFKGNRAIFDLRGPGRYEDLSEAYKTQKQRIAGFIYPILKRSGQLASSLTEAGNPDSIAQILNKTMLILGTKDRTAYWHQTGAGRLPVRPMVFLGPEQVAPDGINRRSEAWIKIINDYYDQVMKKRSAS